MWIWGARALGVLAVLVVVALWVGVPLPWSPACVVRDASGAVIASGEPGEVAARVQRARGDLAVALAAGPAVSCRMGATALDGTAKDATVGLTPRAQSLRTQVRAEFGDLPDGGYGPQETLPGRNPGGEHSLGRAIDFFFRPYADARQQEAGWRLANWAVANSQRLGIRTVIYRDRIWTQRRSAQGWREYRFSGPDPGNPVNRHLDHVHIDTA